ncbi:MAG: C10 family peptidase [Alistipes sp.]|nr:C10 family peptidase [Alistipes sp.]
MKKITFLLAMMLVTFTACHNEDFEEISLESNREKISYEVTPEEAVSRLGMFLSNNGTRASLSDVTIKTLMKSDFVPATRSTDAEDAPAVYLIDIPEAGCAVMGADKRLEPVYAITDETKLSPEDLTTAITRTESASEEDIQTFVTGLINDAVEEDILGIEENSINTTELGPNSLPNQEEWYDTTYICQVSPLLNTKWHQNSPFNDKYPICPRYGQRKAAGCGVIATAQVVYYNRHPNSFQNVNFNWNLISQYEYPANPSYAVNAAVADFIYALADGVNADLRDTTDIVTDTDPVDIKNYFRHNGYPNANFYSYSLSYITPMLNNNKPVIISGWQSNGLGGHGWVIDGCKIFKIDHWIRNNSSSPSEEYIEHTDNYNLLHCNYGWGGTCDGYYTSGIFDTRNNLPGYDIDFSIGDLPGSTPYMFDTNLGIMQY